MTELQRDLPEPVKECEKSILEDNPDMDRGRAIAICQSMHNEGQLGECADCRELDFSQLQDDPCQEGWVMVGTKVQDGEVVPNCVPEEDADPADLADPCPEGHVEINGECVAVDEMDAPPSVLASAPRILSMRELAGPIEREKVDDGVIYRNLKVLDRGVWTDQSSQTPTEYVPSNLEVKDGATVNVMHDESDVSEAGELLADTATVEDGSLFVDVKLTLDTPASEYADEALEAALESNGREGFGGPSVEIPPEGLVLEPNGPNGTPRTEAGRITGLGFVKQPASKTTAFSQQTRERQVALSGQTDKARVLQMAGMDRDLQDPDDIRSTLEEFGFDTDQMGDDDVMDMAESLHDELMEELEVDMEGDDDSENAEHEDEDEDEDDTEMQDGLDVLQDEMQEQIDDLWDAIDDLKEQMATGEEMSAVKEELAAADTVEEIEKRLSDLEDEPKDPKTLADGEEEEEDWSTAESGVGYNSASRTTF